MTDLADRSPNERFDHLLAIISSERFLKMEGLGNEVPFFICPFKPAETLTMNQLVQQLLRKLATQGVRVLEINLYDLSLELLRERGIWDRVLAVEESISKGELKELLQGVLDPEAHLIPTIAAKMDTTDFKVMFITGVGEVFPYIRSHTVLNNLQSAAKERPTVMFFPGAYTHSTETGASLNLFGKLQDDKYYRAFNIYDSQV